MLCLVALPPMARAGRRRPSTSVRRRGRTLAALPCRCGRRHVIGASSAAALLPFLAPSSPAAPPIDPDVMLQRVHPSRPDWYEEFYASAMDRGMKSYEAEVCKASLPALRRLGLAVGSITGFSADYTLQIAGYKAKLFSQLSPAGKSILELGVGTGPNFKYYASEDGVNVIGVDPNKHMENYARTAAVSAGLPSSSFTFRRGVAEALPAEDNSMDAVIGTLVLCSVNNMDMALREIKRVLKPDGLYVFIEHVAAPDGTLLQFVQGTLDPLQQFVADGCHLTRKTGQSIRDVGFSSLSLDSVRLSNAYIISPHVYGVACK